MFNRATLAMTTIFMIMLSGCNGSAAQGFVNLDCGPDVEMNFEDWSSWWKVNPTPLQSEGHSNSYVDVYVDDLAKETYLTASAPYAECARIVKAKYTDETSTEVERLAIMVKMPEDYDTEHNDWWYALYDATGSEVISQGKAIFDCRNCHQRAAETDYLFSEDVMAAAND